MVGGLRSKTALQVIYAVSVLLVAIAAHTLVRQHSVTSRHRLNEGGRIVSRAHCVASGVRTVDGPIGHPARARAVALLNQTMVLARDLGEWQERNHELKGLTRGLFSSLTRLAGNLASLEEMLERMDTRVGALEEARETALDAIRILLYNLVRRDALGGGIDADAPDVAAERDALKAAADLMRAVMEQRRGAVELPPELFGPYPTDDVCDSLAALTQTIEEIEEYRSTALRLLRAAKQRAVNAERAATEFSEELVAAAADNQVIELVLIAVAALGLLVAGMLLLREVDAGRPRPERRVRLVRKVRRRDKDTTR